jgi:hypothetical protein
LEVILGEKIIEDGVEREIIKIVADNEAGWRLGYRDTLDDEYQEFIDPQDKTDKLPGWGETKQ